jgi:hypothetical protein
MGFVELDVAFVEVSLAFVADAEGPDDPSGKGIGAFGDVEFYIGGRGGEFVAARWSVRSLWATKSAREAEPLVGHHVAAEWMWSSVESETLEASAGDFEGMDEFGLATNFKQRITQRAETQQRSRGPGPACEHILTTV